MNRIDRLTAIVLLLQGRKRTAGELAARFELSRRTILRDMQALSEMGVPIVAEAGPEGGYSLPPDYSLPPLALTLHEATLLRLALGGIAGLAATPFAGARTSLLEKIETLLPAAERRAALDALGAALAIDSPPRDYETPFLDLLLEGANAGRWIAATYRSEGGVSRQTLLPRLLRTANGLWYCEAYSHERGELRVYRVDRFVAAEVTSAPPGAELPADTIRHVDPAQPEVRVRLTARGAMRLDGEPYLAARIQRDPDGTGLLAVRLRLADYDWLVGVLLRLGAEAVVLAPDILRRRVRDAATAIARQYPER
jgi:predicted DNA-binding transcriptional regulator YafY